MQRGDDALPRLPAEARERVDRVPAPEPRLPGLSDEEVRLSASCLCLPRLLNARCRGLMEPDEWKNLGLSNLKGDDAPATAKTPSAAEAPDGGTGGKK